jgi:hypothetical protein
LAKDITASGGLSYTIAAVRSRAGLLLSINGARSLSIPLLLQEEKPHLIVALRAACASCSRTTCAAYVASVVAAIKIVREPILIVMVVLPWSTCAALGVKRPTQKVRRLHELRSGTALGLLELLGVRSSQHRLGRHRIADVLPTAAHLQMCVLHLPLPAIQVQRRNKVVVQRVRHSVLVAS